MELIEFKELLAIQEDKRKREERWHANVVSEKTGWSYEKSLRLLRDAKKKGYPYKKFITMALWRMEEEEIVSLPPYVSKMSKTKKTEVEAKNEKARQYREKIMEEMGWTLGRARLEAFRAFLLCGCTGVEFYLFQIYKNGIEAGQKFITAEYNTKMKVRYCDWGGKNNQYFENKGLFNRDFKDYIHRRWFLSDGLSFEKFCSNVSGLQKIICKPLNGIEGKGIKIFQLEDSEDKRWEIYNEIISGPESIIEEFITQHSAISEVYPNSVNTIRVMSFLDNGEGKILNAVMKFGTKSNVDNYYQGGVAAGVDEKTGTLITKGVDYAGNIYDVHPYSGKSFLGFQIPHWDKVVELIRVAAAVHPETPYIGWDIAITPNGPEIVEGNHNQGAYLVQYPFAVYSLEGRRHTLEPYLWFE